MNALTLVFVSLCVFAIAYRLYGLFIANKILGLKDERPTPAVKWGDEVLVPLPEDDVRLVTPIKPSLAKMPLQLK